MASWVRKYNTVNAYHFLFVILYIYNGLCRNVFCALIVDKNGFCLVEKANDRNVNPPTNGIKPQLVEIEVLLYSFSQPSIEVTIGIPIYRDALWV